MIQLQMGDGAALERLRSFPDRLSARLEGVMQTVGGALRDRVAENLSGEVLRPRSGALASGIALDVAISGEGIAATLASGGVRYAAYQEYGFHGVETVRAHLRTIKEAFGRSIAPRQIEVSAYSRRIDYPAHSFLRSALAGIGPEAIVQIKAVVGTEGAA